jgi:Uma2 family endonuclease
MFLTLPRDDGIVVERARDACQRSDEGAAMEYSDLRDMCVLVRKRPGMTSLEYFSTPESVLPTELAFGELVVRDSPSSSHQAAVGSFFVVLREHVRAQRLGDVWVAPLDVVLDEARALIVQPDLFYVSRDRAGIVKKRVHGAPDLVVEVLSPRPRVGDFDRRLDWFAAYGVEECWAYHQPEQLLEIITFADARVDRRMFDADAAIASPCLPGFSLTLRQILER